MSVRTPSNLFIGSSLILHAGFYQRVLRQASNFKELGDKLVSVAEYEQAFRRYDKVNEIAQILINLPLKEHQIIGQYYLGLCKYRKGIDSIDTFEYVAERASTKYRIFAMHSLAAIGSRREDHDAELSWLVQSLKIAPSIQSFRGIAILKAIEGSHEAAVTDFERYLPLTRYAEPLVYYDFLNSYAVELGEVGRKDEARNIMRVVLASPFAQAYPEWRETAHELKSSRRSFVAVGVPHSNVLVMPEREHDEQISLQPKPARVLNFLRLKKKMDKKNRDKQIEKSVAAMSMKEMGFKLLELITSNQADEYQMRTILIFVINLLSAPVKPPDKPSA